MRPFPSSPQVIPTIAQFDIKSPIPFTIYRLRDGNYTKSRYTANNKPDKIVLYGIPCHKRVMPSMLHLRIVSSGHMEA